VSWLVNMVSVDATLLGVLRLMGVTSERCRCSFVSVRVSVLLNGGTQCGNSASAYAVRGVLCLCVVLHSVCVDDVVCTRDKSGMGTHRSIDGATHTRRIVFRERCCTV
jgi:hypothetical protein